MSVVPRCQTNRMPGKEKVVCTRICGEMSCNQILARFLLVKSPTKGLNVLYNPFRERTPTWGRRASAPTESHSSFDRGFYGLRGLPAGKLCLIFIGVGLVVART